MSDDLIRVYMVEKNDRKNLTMYYICPLSGKKVPRTTGTHRRREAERVAAKWEAVINQKRYSHSPRMAWEIFRDIHETHAQTDLRPSTIRGYSAAFNSFERRVHPLQVADLASHKITIFKSGLQRDGLKPATVAGHMRYVKAIANWAYRQGYLDKVPNFEMPKRSKAVKMKGRPITLEEFERMLEVTPSVVGENAAPSWRYLMEGLWWSGLRLGEAMALRWDHQPDGVSVSLDGKHSVLVFDSESQKSAKTQMVPLAPKAYQFIFPNKKRRGYVFNPQRIRGDGVMARHKLKIGRLISRIGEAAGVIVNPETGKTASAHDLRRSFGFRWSRRVMPAELKELMRHASIETTMTYYAGQDAKTTAAALWDSIGSGKGSTLGSSKPKRKRVKKKKRRKEL